MKETEGRKSRDRLPILNVDQNNENCVLIYVMNDLYNKKNNTIFPSSSNTVLSFRVLDGIPSVMRSLSCFIL
jgi:hypothetical protein